jgi:8-amino-7-oxononanoate synthase
MREVRSFDARGVTGKIAGREVVSFASNDYLGLTSHPSVMAAAKKAVDTWGAGSGSARLIVGARPVHEELEEALARWKEKEAALLFPNGYAASLGVLTVFGREGTTILSDELNHASLVDGARLARAQVRVYRHKDLEHLTELLDEIEGPCVVVSDSVFSMDGDVAPVAELTDLCLQRDALLVLDEAHAVLGPELERSGAERVRLGTLSKFLGSVGGFVAADRTFVELLTNTARSFIFTTAGSPADAAAALEAVRIYTSEEGDRLKARLRSLVDRLAPGHPSPIISVHVGDEAEALQAAKSLLDLGFLVPAIRPPTVPPGTARLRVTVSAAHEESQVDELALALEKIVGTRPGA